MIKNIIFDMGRVLIDWDPVAIVRREGLCGEDSDLLLREVFQCAEWTAMDHGWMSQEEGCARICRRLPERLHENARHCVFDWWKAPLDPIPGMAELVREVKALGYGVYLLSNATSPLSEYFPRIPGSECFDLNSVGRAVYYYSVFIAHDLISPFINLNATCGSAC